MKAIHDPAYIEARDRLIPKAEAYAKALAIPCPHGVDTLWDGGFSMKMELREFVITGSTAPNGLFKHGDVITIEVPVYNLWERFIQRVRYWKTRIVWRLMP